MYYIAGILNCKEASQSTVKTVWQWLQSRDIGPETRAICAIFVAKFGTAHYKRMVRQQYDRETEIVRAAIMFSSQFFPKAERDTAKKAWGGHSEINSLIASSI
jgi:hypothetical protein